MLSELNLNYYRPSYIKPFIRQTTDLVNDTNAIGDLCGSIWGYYNPFDPDNAPIRSKPLDETIYLWKIDPSSSAACNACLSIAPSQTLSTEVKINRRNDPVSIAMCFYSLSDTDGGLRKDPKVRLAYDETVWDGWNGKFGGWQNSELFYNINPSKFCLYPVISVFDFGTNSVDTSRTLANMINYINNKPEKRRVTLIRSQLYCGDTLPRTASGMYTPANTVGGLDVGILSDRPLCDNLANTVGSWIRDGEGHENYDISKVYNPFNQCLTQLWYDSSNQYSYDILRQMDIGYYRSATRETYVNGRYEVPNNYGKVTAEFCKISYERHNFDDVEYHWRHCVYYGEVGAEIQNGFPIMNYGSANSNIKTLSILEIDDMKDSASYGEACKRAVLHELAYYGFWIAETVSKAQNGILGSSGDGLQIYLPEKIGGVTTGNYFTGDEIKNVPYADADSTDAFKYKEEETDFDGGHLKTNLQSGLLSGSTSLYGFTASEFEGLMSWLNTTYAPATEDDFIHDFKGVNPCDYVVSVKYFPFDLPASPDVFREVLIGGVNTGLTRTPISREYGTSNSLFDLLSVQLTPDIFPADFRANYTKLLLYIPWCGYTNLDPAVFGQSPDGTFHSVNVKLSIDYTTGSCMGMVLRDDTLIQTVNGTVGIDIPLSAIQQGTFQNNIKQAEIALKQAQLAETKAFLGMVGSTIAMAAAPNPLTMIAGGVGLAVSGSSYATAKQNVEAAEYNLEHIAPSISSISGASPFNGAVLEQQAVLYIFKPCYLSGYDAKIYSHTVGNACNKNGILSSFKGLTVCGSFDLSGIPCTAEEKEMISNYLKGGVIM